MERYQVTQEANILKAAIRVFTDVTGAAVKVQGMEVKEDNKRIDAIIQVTFRNGKQQFYVELKGETRQIILNSLLTQFGKEKEKWLLVAQYIPGPLKEELRKNGINYLEASGNCYINTDNIYFYINDKEVKPVRQTSENRLWKASGLKLLFVLIQDPQLVEAPYRHLSDIAGIALGSLSPLMNELKQEGYLKQKHSGGKEVLVNRSRLLTRWVERYPLILRPKLILGSFRFLTTPLNEEWKRVNHEGIYWGGEPAGDLYTNHLVPEEYMIYTSRQANEIVKLLKIVPDEKGNITVLQKFWRDWPGSKSIQGAVPPLLAYADLISGNDSREWEISEKIKLDYLDGEFIS